MAKRDAPCCAWCGEPAVTPVWTPDGWVWMTESFDEDGRPWHIACEAAALDANPGSLLDELPDDRLAS